MAFENFNKPAVLAAMQKEKEEQAIREAAYKKQAEKKQKAQEFAPVQSSVIRQEIAQRAYDGLRERAAKKSKRSSPQSTPLTALTASRGALDRATSTTRGDNEKELFSDTITLSAKATPHQSPIGDSFPSRGSLERSVPLRHNQGDGSKTGNITLPSTGRLENVLNAWKSEKKKNTETNSERYFNMRGNPGEMPNLSEILERRVSAKADDAQRRYRAQENEAAMKRGTLKAAQAYTDNTANRIKEQEPAAWKEAVLKNLENEADKKQRKYRTQENERVLDNMNTEIAAKRYGINTETFNLNDYETWFKENIATYKNTETARADAPILQKLAAKNSHVQDYKERPVKATAESLLLTPVRSASGMAALIDDSMKVIGGQKVNSDSIWHKGAEMGKDTREYISGNTARKWFGGAELPIIGNAGEFLYNTAMSIGDMAILGGIGGALGLGSAASSAFISAESAADTVKNAKKKGLSDEQAVTLGVLSGAIETATEKYSLDEILKKPKSFAAGVLRSFAAEGSEEIASNILNKAADAVLSGNEADIRQSIKAYEADGMNRKTAIARATIDSLTDDLAAGISGGVAGAVLHGMFRGESKKEIPYRKSEQALADVGDPELALASKGRDVEVSSGNSTSQVLPTPDRTGKVSDDSISQSGENVNENSGSGSDIRYKIREKYDYTKSFAEQIDDWKAGKIPQKDSLIVSGTPQSLKSIGFNSLPITINQKHVDYVINNTKDAGHSIGEAVLKQLPQALEDPIAVIKSKTKPGRVIAVTKFNVDGKQIVAPIEIDGYARNNNVKIDSNAVTSVYGKDSIAKQVYDALNDEMNGEKSIFLWNKKETTSLLQKARHQLPRVLSMQDDNSPAPSPGSDNGRRSRPNDGFVHSIRESGTNVNLKFENVTETQQFKRWFGDWQDPQSKKSMVTNADGTPKKVFKNTDGTFSENGSGEAFYLNIQKPYTQGKAELLTRFDGSEERVKRYLEKRSHDGIAENGRYEIFKPEQAKSANENIGTFDKHNTDTRYKVTEENSRNLAESGIKTNEQSELMKTERPKYHEVLNLAAKRLNINVVIDEKIDGADGYYNKATGELHIARNTENPINEVIKHEITHVLEGNNGYSKLKRYMHDNFSDEWDAKQAEIAAKYERVNKQRTESGNELIDVDDKLIDSEVMAELSEKFQSEEFLNKFAQEKPNLLTNVKNFIDRAIIRLKGIFDKNEISKWEAAQKMWENAVREQQKIQSRAISKTDIETIQSIGRKSIYSFTSEDIRKTENFARKYFNEIGAKSPFFRAWFGDWRTKDRTPVKIVTEKGAQRGNVKNLDTGWDIQISGKVFNESKHKAPNNRAAMPYLEYINGIVENAVLLDTHTIPGEKAKSGNSAMMHSLYALADMGSGTELLKLYVEELNDVNSDRTIKRAYQLQNIENQQLKSSEFRHSPSSISSTADGYSISQNGEDVNKKYQQLRVKGSGASPSLITSTADGYTIAQLAEFVKKKDKNYLPEKSSTVTNADGTPKKVYKNADGSFSETGSGDEFYLNIKNPYTDGIDVLLKRFDNSMNRVRKYVQKRGHDGIAENGRYEIFKPEQAKAAEDNIGTFDKRNTNIRYKATEKNSANNEIETIGQGKSAEAEISGEDKTITSEEENHVKTPQESEIRNKIEQLQKQYDAAEKKLQKYQNPKRIKEWRRETAIAGMKPADLNDMLSEAKKGEERQLEKLRESIARETIKADHIKKNTEWFIKYADSIGNDSKADKANIWKSENDNAMVTDVYNPFGEAFGRVEVFRGNAVIWGRSWTEEYGNVTVKEYRETLKEIMKKKFVIKEKKEIYASAAQAYKVYCDLIDNKNIEAAEKFRADLDGETLLAQYIQQADGVIEKQIEHIEKSKPELAKQIRQELKTAARGTEKVRGIKTGEHAGDIKDIMPEITPTEQPKKGKGVKSTAVDRVLDKYGIKHIYAEDIEYARKNLELLSSLETKEDLINLIITQQNERNGKKSSNRLLVTALDGQEVIFLKHTAARQILANVADVEPISIGKKISTVRIEGMLLKPQVLLRNIIGNSAFKPLKWTGNNIAAVFDMLASIKTGKRTVPMQGIHAKDGVKAGINKAAKEYINIKLAIGEEGKYGTDSLKRSFKKGPLAVGEKLLSYGLQVPDAYAKGAAEATGKIAFEKMNERLKKNDSLEKRGFSDRQIDSIVKQEAKIATFQDDTTIGNMVGKMCDGLNEIGIADGFGLGDIVQPFRKTPSAVITRGFEFSPLGYAKMLYNVGEIAFNKTEISPAQQRKIAMLFGSATTGSGIAALGYWLYKNGIITNGRDDEKKAEKAFRNAEGIGEWQINFSRLERVITGKDDVKNQNGDLLMNTSWLSGIGISLALGAGAAEADGIKDVPSIVGKAAWEQIIEIPTMQTLRNVFQTAERSDGDDVAAKIAVSVATDAINSFIPGVVKDTAKYLDGVQRNPYNEENYVKQATAQIKQSIPGLRESVPAKITPWGEEKKLAKGIYNTFINPFYTTLYQGSNLSDELYRISEISADVMPKVPAKSFSIDGKEYNLFSHDYENYSKAVGKRTRTWLEKIINSDEYKTLSDEDKASVLTQAVSKAEAEIKDAYAENDLEAAGNSKNTEDAEILVGTQARFREKQKQAGEAENINSVINGTTFFGSVTSKSAQQRVLDWLSYRAGSGEITESEKEQLTREYYSGTLEVPNFETYTTVKKYASQMSESECDEFYLKLYDEIVSGKKTLDEAVSIAEEFRADKYAYEKRDYYYAKYSEMDEEMKKKADKRLKTAAENEVKKEVYEK